MAGKRLRNALAHAAVPLLFTLLCVTGILVAHITPGFLLRELLSRFARNAVLVTALLIPILAGLGLNFGIVVGAMAGQIGAILVTYWRIGGGAGLRPGRPIPRPPPGGVGLRARRPVP